MRKSRWKERGGGKGGGEKWGEIGSDEMKLRWWKLKKKPYNREAKKLFKKSR